MVTVPAGQAEAPVTVQIGEATVPGQLTAPGLLAGDAPEPTAGQVVRQLHFVLPHLAAGASVAAVAHLGQAPAGEGFAWEAGDAYDELRLGERRALRYERPVYDPSSAQARENSYKVFHHVYDPSGERVVTKGPGGLYTHHRGLMYGFMKTTYGDGKQVDIWHCKGDTHQAHVETLAHEAGPVLGRHRVLINWHGIDNEVFATEQRELTVWAVPGGWLIQFASRLSSAGGDVSLDGDPQHAGFHFRASNEVAETTKGQTIYLRPDGEGEPGKERNWPGAKDHVDLPWLAMSFVLGDQRYTAAYLDRPANPKEARFSERSYGRFGSYFVHTLDEEHPLTVGYRVWLQKGPMRGDEVARLAADFTEPVAAVVRPDRPPRRPRSLRRPWQRLRGH